MTTKNIFLNELMLEAENNETAYLMIVKAGKHTLNFEKHDPKEAVKLFYSIAPTILEICNKHNDSNNRFQYGERKEFAKMLYDYFMENEF